MQEIIQHIFIETGYPGVTLGAISWPHGLILIDAPFRQEDVRAWRSSLMNFSGGVDRVLVNLDSHLDRTMGVRLMDCTVIGHEQIGSVYRNRPMTFKAQSGDSGSEWELHEGLGSIRWAQPEISFTDQLHLHWDNKVLLLEHHPGPCPGSIWAILPENGVIFVGDAVTPNQPPFLTGADIPAWLESLAYLSQNYSNYLIVSGRAGLVRPDQIKQQSKFLQSLQQKLQKMAEKGASPDDTRNLIPRILADLEIPLEMEPHYDQRLRHGLRQYYSRHFRGEIVETDEES